MPKRFSKDARPRDINQAAYQQVQLSTAEPEAQQKTTRSEISRIMSEMGRKGGKIGGKRRLQTMTAEDRVRVAVKAAKARWSKRRKAR